MSRNVPLIIGNWKMYKTGHQAAEFVSQLGPVADRSTCLVYLATPFTAIEASSGASKGHKLIIGAQTMSEYDEGAYTGEVSAAMIKEAGSRFTLIGHSERRVYFHETDEILHKKLKAALKHQLQPILCIGETQEERDQGNTEKVLKRQIAAALEGINEEALLSLVIAYEPVWAIGSGRTATPEMAGEMHHYCRGVLKTLYMEDFAEQIPLLYGGSVKPENTRHLLSMPDIDGALVGGASLKIDSFTKIIHEAEEAKR